MDVPAIPKFRPRPPVGGKLCAASPASTILPLLNRFATWDFIRQGARLRYVNGISHPRAVRMISRHRSGVKDSAECVDG